MSRTNYDIALYNSPYFEDLISELYRISRYKRSIYRKIRNEEEYKQKLSFEERVILRDLSAKENKIILEILVNKHWLNMPAGSIDFFTESLGDKFYFLSPSETEKYEANKNN